MIGDGGHARQVRAEFGDINVVAIGDNAARKRAMDAREPTMWDTGVWGRVANDPPEQTGIGDGTVVMWFGLVCCGAKVGRGCIVNHHATVDHDAVLGDYVHVAPGARVLGGAKVGEGAFIGANAVVLPMAVVPPWVIVRACSVYPNDYDKGVYKLKPVK